MTRTGTSCTETAFVEAERCVQRNAARTNTGYKPALVGTIDVSVLFLLLFAPELPSEIS